MNILKHILAGILFLLVICSCSNETTEHRKKNENPVDTEEKVDSIITKVIINDFIDEFKENVTYLYDNKQYKSIEKEYLDSSQWNPLVRSVLKTIGYQGIQKEKDINLITLYSLNNDSLINIDYVGGVTIHVVAKNNSFHHRLYKQIDGKFQNIAKANAEIRYWYDNTFKTLLKKVIYPEKQENDTCTMITFYNEKMLEENGWNDLNGLHRLREIVYKIKLDNKKD